MRLISSQPVLSDAIVNRKVQDRDFWVLISPTFEFNGGKVAVLLDGHHAYHAAVAAGCEPDMQVYSGLPEGNIEMLADYLNMMMYSSHYHWVDSGKRIRGFKVDSL